ncbi:hypothetical protein [Bergeyella porcorum]|uniref:hypothetical protein n=1 Tax=Bergeyella porcorum TaxID=1735111 RepID=UPI002E1B4821
MVDADAIRAKKFKSGARCCKLYGRHFPAAAFGQLGCEVVKLYCEPNGHFPHNPEPLKEHLIDICEW